MKAQRGFTLIELMVSLVVFSFAIAGVLAVAVSMSQGYRDQRANVATEGAARVPMDFLADAIRQASPGAPTGIIYDATQAACGSNAITVTNNNGSADGLDIIYASGGTVTTTWDVAGAGITIATGSITINVRDTTGFSVGDHVVLSNTSQGHYFAITAITPGLNGSLTVTDTSCSDGTVYPVGSIVIRAQHALFYVDSVNNQLMMNAKPTGVYLTDAGSGSNQPLADGIEDMQLALAIDTTNNANTAMTESATAGGDMWLYNVAGETTPLQNAGGTLRAIRVTLIARTLTQMLGSAALYSRPAAEDHTAGSGSDNYRRRLLRSVAEVRNIGESP